MDEKPKKKGRGCLMAVIVVAALIVLVGVFAGKGAKPKKVDSGNVDTQTDGEVNAEQTEGEAEFGVGETADLNGIQTTLVSVDELTGSEYNKPADGNTFLICTFEINNNSNKEINVSSMMSVKAYADGYAVNSSMSAEMETDVPTLDGTVAAGKSIKGVIGYEVPSDWRELEINFTPDYWGGTDIIFKINK